MRQIILAAMPRKKKMPDTPPESKTIHVFNRGADGDVDTREVKIIGAPQPPNSRRSIFSADLGPALEKLAADKDDPDGGLGPKKPA